MFSRELIIKYAQTQKFCLFALYTSKVLIFFYAARQTHSHQCLACGRNFNPVATRCKILGY